MQILMGLVIAMFIITAVYVGMHAAEDKQEHKEDYADGHSIDQKIETFNENSATVILSIVSKTVV